MPLSLTVTPGITITGDQNLSADDFNSLGAPTVEIEDESITAAQIDTADLLDALGDALRGTNYLPWGNFREEKMASASVNCPDGSKTYPLAGWRVVPAGAAATATFVAKNSSTTTADEYRASLKVAAVAQLTTLKVGTWLPPGLCQMLSTGEATFSIYVRNRTGTSFTPELNVYTAGTLDDESSLALADTIAGAAVADSTWVRQSFTFDPTPGSMASWKNGAFLEITITGGGGVLATGEYVMFADGQIDTGTSATERINVPPALPDVPPGTIFPYVGTVAPPGWLLCDGGGEGYAAAKYPGLFGVIGYTYGGSAGTFNVPDLRGRVPVGAEIAGSSQSRLEVTVTAASSSSDVITFAAGVTEQLSLGMGAMGNAFIPAGAYIIAITPTTVQLSAATTGSVAGSIRFSKLGTEDAQTLGADGTGPTYGRRRIKIAIPGCGVTNGSPLITMPGTAAADKHIAMREVVIGMNVSDGSTGFATGTTITAFCCWTGAVASGQVVASANWGGSTGTAILYFELNAPEGDEFTATNYADEVLVYNDCEWYNASAWLEVGDTSRLRPGMYAVSAGAGFPSGTPYIVSIDSSSRVSLSGTATNNTSSQVVTFTGASVTRTPTPISTSLPAVTVHWIIKT